MTYDDHFPREEAVLSHYLIQETERLIENSFESQIVDPNHFEILCFLVVCERNIGLDLETISECMSRFEFSTDILIETIEDLFSIHDLRLPGDLLDVTQKLSKILPWPEFQILD